MMNGRRGKRSEEMENRLIDLNEVSIEKKRKRVESKGSPKVEEPGRVLRSRRIVLSDDGKGKDVIVEKSNKKVSKSGKRLGRPPKCRDGEMSKADEIEDPIVSLETNKDEKNECGVVILSDNALGEEIMERADQVEIEVPAMSLQTRRRGRSRNVEMVDGEMSKADDIEDPIVSLEKNKVEKNECGVVTLSDNALGEEIMERADQVEIEVPAVSLQTRRRGRSRNVEMVDGEISKAGGQDKSEVPVVVSEKEDGLGEGMNNAEKCDAVIVSEHVLGADVMETSEQAAREVPAVSLQKKKRGRPRKGEGKYGVVKDDVLNEELNVAAEKDGSSVPEVSADKKKKDRGVMIVGEQVLETEMVETSDQVERELPAVFPQKKKRGRPRKGEAKFVVNENSVITDKEQLGRIVLTADRDESGVPTASVQIKKGRRGRPPKDEGKCEVSSVCFKKKKDNLVLIDGETQVMEDNETKVLDISQCGKKKNAKRGRPPKDKGIAVNSSLIKLSTQLRRKRMVAKLGSPPKKDVEVMEHDKILKSTNGMRQLKRRLGRPPQMENGLDQNKRVKINVDEVKVSSDEMRRSEQKQQLRDQIVDMLFRAGWTVEYRPRLYKDYQDAVYVDRENKTYWSVTKAYRRLKEMIDKGEATDVDIAAFNLIPDETFSMLFRVTTVGKKLGQGKRKNTAGKSVNKVGNEGVPKVKSSAGMSVKKVGKKGVSKVKCSVGKFIKKVGKKGVSKVKSNNKSTESRIGKSKRRTLLARRPGEGLDEDGYKFYEGKRSVLSWMIDMGTVSIGGKVIYKRGRNMMLSGKITRDGICCDCCNTTHTMREFESHAKTDTGKPYQNIYVESGNTLFQCLVDSLKKHMEINSVRFNHVNVDGGDPNDDTCNVCGDGGDLVCCESCPSTFHHGCLDIEIPSGDLECVYCSCKFCGMASESTYMSDDIRDSSSDLIMCQLCEEKFHGNCIKEKFDGDFNQESTSFCGSDCRKIFEQLQILLGVRHELEEGFSYMILHNHEGSCESPVDGDYSTVESNSKLAVAFTVMDECFKPIIDERSGTNMIQNVVYNYGSNIRRLNYVGFYTIILEKGDELVAAASIRVHGNKLAEMPFIGVRITHRRKGMCSRLLTAIEMVLSSLGVEKLVIPAISELKETWTKIFGFSPLEESKRREMKYMSLIVFPMTNLLQKPLVAHGSTKTKTASEIVKSQIGEVGKESGAKTSFENLGGGSENGNALGSSSRSGVECNV